MDDLQQMSLQALKEFESVVENSKEKLRQACDKMDEGISMCASGMKDEPSQKALRDARQITAEIRECLDPTEKLLILVKDLIDVLTQQPTM